MFVVALFGNLFSNVCMFCEPVRVNVSYDLSVPGVDIACF